LIDETTATAFSPSRITFQPRHLRFETSDLEEYILTPLRSKQRYHDRHTTPCSAFQAICSVVRGGNVLVAYPETLSEDKGEACCSRSWTRNIILRSIHTLSIHDIYCYQDSPIDFRRSPPPLSARIQQATARPAFLPRPSTLRTLTKDTTT
jgi:hypothetical protein